MRSTDEVLDWRGRTAYDREGSKLGTLEEVYLDAESGQPEWAAVKTGLFGNKLTFVPLEGAREQGDDVMLDWPEAVVKDAPRIDSDGELSPEEEDRLYDHYERFDSPEYHGGGGSGGGVREFTDRAGAADRDDRDVTDRASRPDHDDERAATERDDDSARIGVSPTASTAGAGVGLGAAAGTQASRSGGDEEDTGARRVASGGGQSDAGISSAARRPRIKRYITEELGPDGNPIRRETRTEETFD